MKTKRRPWPRRRQGTRSRQNSFAHRESIDPLRKGRALIEQLPLTSERLAQKFAMQLALGAALRVLKGSSSPEVLEVLTQAHNFALQDDKPLQRMAALDGMYISHLMRGEVHAAHQLAVE